VAAKASEKANRSRVAEACLDFGTHLLRIRTSSVTPSDAENSVTELFEWFEDNDAFTPQNTGIAVHAIDFGKELLESRKTSTVREASDAIQRLYSSLTK